MLEIARILENINLTADDIIVALYNKYQTYSKADTNSQ